MYQIVFHSPVLFVIHSNLILTSLIMKFFQIATYNIIIAILYFNAVIDRLGPSGIIKKQLSKSYTYYHSHLGAALSTKIKSDIPSFRTTYFILQNGKYYRLHQYCSTLEHRSLQYSTYQD